MAGRRGEGMRVLNYEVADMLLVCVELFGIAHASEEVWLVRSSTST